MASLVMQESPFPKKQKNPRYKAWIFLYLVGQAGFEPATKRL